MFRAYKKGWQAIVQPPRYSYNERNLGPQNIIVSPDPSKVQSKTGINKGGDEVLFNGASQNFRETNNPQQKPFFKQRRNNKVRVGNNPLDFKMKSELVLDNPPAHKTQQNSQQNQKSQINSARRRDLQFTRHDFQVAVHHDIYSANSKMQNDIGPLKEKDSIKCSLFAPSARTINDRPCLIYCHTHSGNRLEGLFLREHEILKDFDLCLFDFTGCGNSSGDFVTLGLKESEEIILLVNYLKTKLNYKKFLGWGRSMGAVSWLLALDKFQKNGQAHLINSVVVDSPFTKARTMVSSSQFQSIFTPSQIADLMNYKTNVPETLIKGALIPIRASIRKNIG